MYISIIISIRVSVYTTVYYCIRVSTYNPIEDVIIYNVVCNIVYMVFDMSFIDRKMSSESTKILLKELLPINVVLLQFAKSSV